LVLLLTFLVTACNGGKATITPTPMVTPTEFPIVLTATALANQIQNPETAVAPTETLTTPEPTAATQIRSQIVFWAPEDVDAAQAQTYFDQLSEYSDQNGVTLERCATLEPAEISEQVKVVVSMASAPAIHSIAPTAQQVQFLAVGAGEVPTGGNVHAVSASGVSIAQRAFLAGYTLALTTTDYRVGVLSQAGTADGVATKDGFVIGAQYYCGICNSRYAPILFYPIAAEITDPTNPVDWQTAADALLSSAVTAMFVQPEVSTSELMSYLQIKNVRVILAEGQAGGGGANVVAVLSSSGAVDLTPTLNDLLVGLSVGTVTSSINLMSINDEIITPGRLGLIERVKAELLAGEIQPSR
jgi:hypothetical protein